MSLQEISPNLTEDHLHEIIRKFGGVKYTSWSFDGNAAKKGDSYLSELHKVIVTGEDDKGKSLSIHLIIKTSPKSAGRRKTFRSAEFFRNEINFYEIIAKNFNEFQTIKKDAKYPFKEMSTCLVSHLDGINDFLIMENLNEFGYFPTSRQQAMDLSLCRLIMQTLGRFHGLSFIIRDQSPNLFEQLSIVLDETYYAARLKNWYGNFIQTQIEIALDAVEKIYGGTEIEAKAKKFLKDGNLYDKMVKFTHTRNRFSVISHGDCWTPNFLIKTIKHDGKDIPVKAKMIDFQLARFASPALDISFFIYSCTTEELRAQHYDDLLKAYHDSLSEIIKDFGSNPEFLFPFSALEAELKSFARFGVGMGIESIPFSVMDDNETADMEKIKGDEAVPITDIWILKKLENIEDQRRLADIFKHAVDRGYLD
ncbi:hypothetical protein PVAND_016271 [Polypedilum vanderplanki]|uniref:CHK kinase-like domain-containing protein n=1 Tax=Polypedilum vanderplanki TaxID=319348 RepID=A0A9J6BFE2_POLVA|nr:hypothetical protein PVAND_016271 [Polypedilum vanderplanki]